MVLEVIYIILGLLGLWLGTRWIISGAVNLSYRLKLSHTFIGVGILAIGTDLPEMFVSVKASILQLGGTEASGIITGNAIGSCIGQISLILGISALFIKFIVPKKEIILNGVALILSIALLFFFGLNGKISRWEGGTLVLIYVIYYIILLKSGSRQTDSQDSFRPKKIIWIIILFLTGFSVLILSSHFVVENAMGIANRYGLAQSFVGIIIIGVGTSLPELAVSIGAAFKKAPGMSIGNIIGSNIFDGLIPIGIGGLISSTKFEKNLLIFDLPILFFSTILVMVFLIRKGISRTEGIVMLTLFLIYLAAKIVLFSA